MLLIDELPQNEFATTTDLVVNRIDTTADFVALRDEWNRLAGDAPFCRWEWLEAWWQWLGGGKNELFILCVRDADDRLIGLAPWYVENSPLFGRIVRFLGSDHACSDYLTILADAENQQRVAERIADWMIDESNALWDAIDFDGVAVEDAAIETFLNRVESRNLKIDKFAGLNCWRVALPDSWESYLMCLSKSRRERVRQLHRRQFDTGRAVIHRAESAADFTRGFDILVELHDRRRSSMGDAGCFSELGFEAFLRDAASRFLDLGLLRLQWIEMEERPIAVQLDFLGGETAYHYQSGIDPSMHKERPGWLGVSATLKWAIGEGYTCYDFLRGNETYKTHWRGEPVATLDVRIAGRSVSSRLRHELWLIKQRLKKWVKSRLRPA